MTVPSNGLSVHDLHRNLDNNLSSDPKNHTIENKTHQAFSLDYVGKKNPEIKYHVKVVKQGARYEFSGTCTKNAESTDFKLVFYQEGTLEEALKFFEKGLFKVHRSIATHKNQETTVHTILKHHGFTLKSSPKKIPRKAPTKSAAESPAESTFLSNIETKIRKVFSSIKTNLRF
jgi:hypothetical protein